MADLVRQLKLSQNMNFNYPEKQKHVKSQKINRELGDPNFAWSFSIGGKKNLQTNFFTGDYF